MKHYYNCCIIMLFSFAVIGAGQSASTNSTQTIVTPNAKTTVIILKDKHWTIEELNKKALEALWRSESIPKDATYEARVGIFPTDKITMCEISHFRGFGQPVWVVKFGYDGEILKTEKHIAKEGP